MNSFIGDISYLTDEDYNLFYSLMSSSRKERVDRLKFIEDKKSTVLGELLVKKHYGMDTVISYNSCGKPYMENKKGEFSISHSKGMVAVAVSDFPVGIDIEKIRDINIDALKRAINEKEREYISFYNNSIISFLEIWTFKEAYYKYEGTGKTKFANIDYFNQSIKREKIIIDEYVMHIVY